ncbi:MAG: aminoglycoside phosphotransferase family protein [Clostridiales bacterium]|nr:aminoglycoside phosphotransferase family protein [Clostridiales bacterium]
MGFDAGKYAPFLDRCFNTREYTLCEIEKGLSDDVKFKADVGGESYAVKIVEGKREGAPVANRLLWYKALQAASEADGRIASPKWFDGVDGHVVTVTQWIDGVAPTEYLAGNPTLQIEYGKKAGEILRALHGLRFVKSEIKQRGERIAERVVRKIDGLIECVEERGISFVGSDGVIERLKSGKGVISESRAGMVHNDVRLENFIVSGGDIYLFDFDSGVLGDCYADFAYLTALSDKDFRVFSYAALNSYFGGKIPEEFWEANMYFCMVKLVEYAVYKFNKCGGTVVKQAKSCMEIFGDYKNAVPDWWDGIDKTYRKQLRV